MSFRNTLRLLLSLLLSVLQAAVYAQTNPENTLIVAEPFIELHTGPGDAYPVFHVIDRGQRIEVLVQKTNWYRVRKEGGVEGWVDRDQLQQTLNPDGQRLQLSQTGIDDYVKRRWELGVTTGELEDAPALSMYAGYALTPNLSAETTLEHSIGSISSSSLFKFNLLMQPFHQWAYSPFFTLGLGRIEVEPKVTLVNPQDRSSDFGQIGLGFKKYISERFILRAEINEYIIFSASTDKDSNEEIGEWKIGFAVFF